MASPILLVNDQIAEPDHSLQFESGLPVAGPWLMKQRPIGRPGRLGRRHNAPIVAFASF
jgi:hypothetical protein